MNYSYLSVNENEDDLYNKFLFDTSIKPYHSKILESWNRIFLKEPESDWDLNFIVHPKECVWQGCVWFLRKEWLI